MNGIATYVVWPPKRWMKIETKVEKDRIPMRRSFSQCTFGNILSSSKDFDETNDGMNSSNKGSDAHRNTEDIVAMKRKFLSDDRFLGSGAVTLSREEKSSMTGSNSLNVTDTDMPKLRAEPKDSFNIVPEESSELPSDIEPVGHLEDDSNDSRNGVWNRMERNFKEEGIEGNYEVEQPSEDLAHGAKNSALVGGETGTFSTTENVVERTHNSIHYAENESEVVVEIESEGLS